MNNKKLMVSILSLSLLTVMAGAAVAPALGVIKAYFADSNQLLVLIICSAFMPVRKNSTAAPEVSSEAAVSDLQ